MRYANGLPCRRRAGRRSAKLAAAGGHAAPAKQYREPRPVRSAARSRAVRRAFDRGRVQRFGDTRFSGAISYHRTHALIVMPAPSRHPSLWLAHRLDGRVKPSMTRIGEFDPAVLQPKPRPCGACQNPASTPPLTTGRGYYRTHPITGNPSSSPPSPPPPRPPPFSIPPLLRSSPPFDLSCPIPPLPRPPTPPTVRASHLPPHSPPVPNYPPSSPLPPPPSPPPPHPPSPTDQ